MGSTHGLEHTQDKRTLNDNMAESYHRLPLEVDSLRDMFSKGIFYGRLRLNSFGFRWDDEVNINEQALRKNHSIAGFGGSLIYKSAYLNGFSLGAGLYATQAYGSLEDKEAALYKSGKGTLSRRDLFNKGKQSILTFAQAYLEYKNKQLSMKVGRQIFESFLTASNDTKMIPNTFEGLTLNVNTLEDTEVKIAYLTKQKLRDHSSFHHVLASADITEENLENFYSQNDDSAMHIGLSQSKLDAAGIEDRLIVFDAHNKSVENLLVHMNYTAVPELISSAMLQLDYAFNVDGLSIIPALRYMQQFDNGAGQIAGANLKTITEGYSKPESLDSWLLGARVDLGQDAWHLRFGYTKIADKGDIVAPWRGFPTAGFTRTMAQYNWYANTITYMLRAEYDFEKAGLFSGLKTFVHYAIQDFDDKKAGVIFSDSEVLTLDILQESQSIPNLYIKFRMGHVFGDAQKGDITKLDPSYDEARFEINYLF